MPVTDGEGNLIPLPQQADPNAVLAVDLKLAARSRNPKRVTVATPIVDAPVMLAEWKLEPDTAQRLVYRDGSLTPAGGVPDISGFAGLARMFRSRRCARSAACTLVAALALVGAGRGGVARGARDGVYKFSARHWSGVIARLRGVRARGRRVDQPRRAGAATHDAKRRAT